jgi:Fe-S-cluster-containing hydrogenase component 2/CRP-like cAMP-binding protein
MKSLDLDWPSIEGWLKKIPGFDPKAVQPYFQEGQLKKGIHFFLIEYEPGEIIMAKGSTSDFAAVHLQGIVRVADAVPTSKAARSGCWQKPALRRLENIVLNPPLATPRFRGGREIALTAGTAGEYTFPVWALSPVTFIAGKREGQSGLPAFIRLERDTLVMNVKGSTPGTYTFTITAENGSGSVTQDVTLVVHPADNPAPPPESPKRPGSLFPFLRPLYRVFPSLPLGLVKAADFWLSPAAGDRVRRHIAGVFGGRALGAPRPERDVSRPTEAAKVDLSTSGVGITVRDRKGNERPIEDRFMGITGALWNQNRSVTLVADNDGDDKCRMLLIKRKAFQEIIKKAPAFYEKKMIEFVDQTLPTILAKNRLFRDRFFYSEVNWAELLLGLKLKSPTARLPRFLRAFLAKLSPDLKAWLGTATADVLQDEDKVALLKQINLNLARRDMFDVAMLDGFEPFPGDEFLVQMAKEKFDKLNDVQVTRLNRILLQFALPKAFKPGPPPCPMTRAEFQAFTRSLAKKHQSVFNQPLQPLRVDLGKGDERTPIVKQGDPADSVYLILSGMVRVHFELAGGRTMVNNLEADAFFGEAAILEAAGAGGELPKRKATVEPLCASNLLKLDRKVLLDVLHEDSMDTEFENSVGNLKRYNFSTLAQKLRQEHESYKLINVQIGSGRILPPNDPPLAIAQQLVLTRNVLLINMDNCTRCDQCVRGCAEAHDGLPRFHRANPDMRFGSWEVAGACMNCLDSPCQQVCPVGAITLLDNEAVQIHRDRCVSCEQCFKACPFDVIDMYHPLTAEEAPSMSPKKGTVATKCDLCLTDTQDPPCVACCPYDAAKRVDPLEFFPELREWANIAFR